MARFVAVAVVGAVLMTASGCKSSPDSLLKEMIAGMNNIADSIEKGEPPEKQKAIADKVKATAEKLEKLNLSADQKKALQEKYKEEMTKAMMRILNASMKQAGSNPGVKGPDLGNLFK